ncbi:MAG: NUDIX hydrolase [Parcubacteria group bacterium GW2011_GWC2_32_10]|nr:MAG: NUDIX hydrolase [Parcubacteria group bacterium GW2011_GWC2_32_10]OGZ81116.1 MAG: hypothetical protein A2256_02460 [Candidatus Staskawiczbacteria bacterium RIFOXYA2_FULL_32_7]
MIRKTQLEKWQKLGEKKVLAKSFGVELSTQNFTNPKTRKTETFSIFCKKEGIIICPITENGNVVLVRQFKQGVDDFVLEFPAGSLEKSDKSRAEAGKRELLEETGYVPNNVIAIETANHIAPRKSPSSEYVVIATNCRLTSQQNLDASEGDIEVFEVSVATLFDLIKSGEITSAPTKLAVLTALVHGYLSL